MIKETLAGMDLCSWAKHLHSRNAESSSPKCKAVHFSVKLSPKRDRDILLHVANLSQELTEMLVFWIPRKVMIVLLSIVEARDDVFVGRT